MNPIERTRRNRLAVALGIAIASGALTHVLLIARKANIGASDFTYSWLAARFLLRGLDPYRAILAADTPYQRVFLYPLPTGLIAMPTAWLTAHAAGVVFMAASMGILSYALTRDGWWRLLVVASAPAYVAVNSVQWSPLLCAAALWPFALGLAIVKPHLALPLVAYQRRWRSVIAAVVGAAVLCALALIIQPRWPAEWIAVLRSTPVTSQYHIPILAPWGCWLVLAALAWRTPEGRLVLVLASIPQNFSFYDQLPLLLVARSRRQLLLLVATSWCAEVAFDLSDWHATTFQGRSDLRIPHAMLGLYLPALAVALWNARGERVASVIPVISPSHRAPSSRV